MAANNNPRNAGNRAGNHVRNDRVDTQKHHYKEHDETLTNDANYDAKGRLTVDGEFDDTSQNADTHANDHGME